MISLSIRKTLSNAIINACINEIDVYKQALKNNIKRLESVTNEEESQPILFAIRQEYLDAVANSVFNTFKIGSPNIFNKIQLTLYSPSSCGYDIDLDNGIMAGSVYAICYYSIKDKIAKPDDCIKLNHIQHAFMEKALTEVENEIESI